MLALLARTVARLLMVSLAVSLFTLAQAPPSAHADDNAQLTASASTTSARKAARVSLEDQVLTLTNRQRRAHGCPTLRKSTALRTSSRGHSERMGRANKISHRLPGEPYFSTRITRAGYTNWRRVAENVAHGYNGPREVVRAWMKSPSHRRNILDCRLRELGVGVVFKNDTIWWTQNFGRR